jgi:threonine dehydrogenase-like Zn-dependent dehydrogenase
MAKAAVLTGPRAFEIRDIKAPDAPPAGGALLSMEGCGMCGSDVEQYEGAVAKMGMMTFPCIPGHEPLGRIAAMDREAARRWGLKEGDRVAVHGVAACGACKACREGRACMDAFYYGFRGLEVGSGLWGGFAETLEIAPRTRLYPVSERISIEDALLYNPLAAGFDWVVKQAGVALDESVLVLGGGQRGLASVIAAKEAGASAIIVTGLRRDAFKLEIARKLGATHTLIVEDVDVREEVRRITGGLGVDKVIETTPLAFSPIADALATARPGGTIVLAGLKANKPMPEFPVDEVITRRLKIVGALSSSDWSVAQAIRTIESGRYPLALMHTHSLPLEQVEHAVHLLAGEVPTDTPLHISILPQMSASGSTP